MKKTAQRIGTHTRSLPRPSKDNDDNDDNTIIPMSTSARSRIILQRTQGSMSNTKKMIAFILLVGLLFYNIQFRKIKLGAQTNNMHTHTKTTTEMRTATTTATAAAAATQSHGRPWPERVFTCGYHFDIFASLLFPNVPSRRYGHLANYFFAKETDALVFGLHGPCGLPFPSYIGPEYVQSHFPGTAIFFNAERYGDARGHNTYQVGAMPDSNRSVSGVYFGTKTFLELRRTPAERDVFFDPSKKPINTGERGAIYVATNCVGFREEAADRISDVDPDNLIVDYGGHCRGKRMKDATKRREEAKHGQVTPEESQENQSKLVKAPVIGLHIRHRQNWKVYQNYRYCLVMENKAHVGYITEKIVLAFMGGCVPIYYGTREIFNVFNKDAFVFYDIDHPEAALEQIRYMEKENHTAYQEMLSQPILANGTDTIERYFSLDDNIGGGKLIRKIREMLGYDPNPPQP